MKFRSFLAGALSISTMTLAAAPATSAVIVNVTETGGDTTFSIEGTLNTSDTTLIGPSTSFDVANIFAPNRQIASMPDMVPINIFSLTGPAAAFGPASAVLPTDATSRAGDLFAITNVDLSLAQSYVSGSSLSSSLLFEGSTIADLGLISGTYVWNLSGSNDTITMTIPAAVVPLPAGLPLLGAGLLALVTLRRRQ